MTFWDFIHGLVVGLGCLSLLGCLALVGIWALYAIEGRTERRAARRERRHIDRVLRAYEKELR